MRVIDGVHDATPNVGFFAFPTGATSFARTQVSRVSVANLSDRGVAFAADHADFARR
jgi:hypothetical protein